MANILEKSDFLTIVKDKEDGRIQRLELTEYCVDYFEQRQESEEKYMEMLFTFCEEMLFGYFRGMKQLKKNVKEEAFIIHFSLIVSFL